MSHLFLFNPLGMVGRAGTVILRLTVITDIRTRRLLRGSAAQPPKHFGELPTATRGIRGAGLTSRAVVPWEHLTRIYPASTRGSRHGVTFFGRIEAFRYLLPSALWPRSLFVIHEG